MVVRLSFLSVDPALIVMALEFVATFATNQIVTVPNSIRKNLKLRNNS